MSQKPVMLSKQFLQMQANSFENDKKEIFFSASLRKEVSHKGRKGTKQKNATHFPLCLRVLVAKFNFCKKLFITLLNYLSLAAYRNIVGLLKQPRSKACLAFYIC